MNHGSIITITVTLLLTSSLASAGSITDTYTTGDPLTATTLTNIKTAVNDNDANKAGITFSTSGNSVSLTTTYIVMETLTVTAPSSGFVHCATSGFIDVSNIAATNFVNGGWDLNNITTATPDNLMWSRQDGSTNDYTPITSMNTYTVSAGTNTFSYKMRMTSGVDGDLRYFERGYSCMFFPTTY